MTKQFAAQDNRQALRFVRRDHVQKRQLASQHHLVQKQQGTFRLLLGAWTDVAVDGKAGKERFDLRFAG